MDGHLARPLGTVTPRVENITGSMFEKRRRESDKEIIKRVEELAKKHSVKMCQVALEWSERKVSSPIVGSNTVSSYYLFLPFILQFLTPLQAARLQETIVTQKVLTEEEIKYLEEP
jgi:Aldo/keto reductase family